MKVYAVMEVIVGVTLMLTPLWLAAALYIVMWVTRNAGNTGGKDE
jgi:hypothetical protein